MGCHGYKLDSLHLKGVSSFVKQVLIKSLIYRKSPEGLLGRWYLPKFRCLQALPPGRVVQTALPTLQCITREHSSLESSRCASEGPRQLPWVFCELTDCNWICLPATENIFIFKTSLFYLFTKHDFFPCISELCSLQCGPSGI